jgi:hypothetical protein
MRRTGAAIGVVLFSAGFVVLAGALTRLHDFLPETARKDEATFILLLLLMMAIWGIVHSLVSLRRAK